MEIDLLIDLVKKESITPNECGIYTIIKNILPDFKCIEQSNFGIKNIFLYKDFRKDKKHDNPIHLCFAGHVDVVKSGDGWDYHPFSGYIEDGFVYGRGTQDMKGGIASFISAIKNIHNFNGIVSVLLTSDEEGEAKYGTKIMLKKLKEINLLPNMAIVAEPTSSSVLGDNIKIGRRGSINGIINIYGTQGHVAYPDKFINPIDLIAPILPKLSNVLLDSGDDYFDPSRLVVTDIRAGMEVVNVTPGSLKIMFNVRNNPLTNINNVEEYLRILLETIPYDLALTNSASPFITKSKILIDAMIRSVNHITSITPMLSTNGGTSDARFFGEFGVDVIEIGHVNDRIHAINERVRMSDVTALKDIFVGFINNINKL